MADCWYMLESCWSFAFLIPERFHDQEFKAMDVISLVPGISLPQARAYIGQLRRAGVLKQQNGRTSRTSQHGPTVWAFTQKFRDFVQLRPEYIEDAKKRAGITV